MLRDRPTESRPVPAIEAARVNCQSLRQTQALDTCFPEPVLYFPSRQCCGVSLHGVTEIAARFLIRANWSILRNWLST